MKKVLICATTGIFGNIIASLLGGWTGNLNTMLFMMAADWITGLIVAGVFKKSTKTENGKLNSSVGLKGLCKKGMMLLLVVVAHRFDLTIGTGYIRDTVIIALIVNEAISLLENAKLMGVRIPKVIYNAIEVIKNEKEIESESEDI
ncbi:MAG: phage holin family protein [Lachnospiraceae bacterium]|nr:phage holin family protein [Lachnospiraceae bacterium]